MYKAVRYFTDLQDNNYPYKAGDTVPRKGLDVTVERLAELSTGKNKRGIPVIEEVKEETKEEKPKETPKATKPRSSRKKG